MRVYNRNRTMVVIECKSGMIFVPPGIQTLPSAPVNKLPDGVKELKEPAQTEE